MKKFFCNLFYIMMVIIGLTSCLEWGLGNLETYSGTEITAVNFEYRWMIPENEDDPWAGEKLQVQTLTTNATFSEGKIECEITVPSASGTFTEEERDNVTLRNICAYVTISPGATISPNGSSPVLGGMDDFSQSDLSYKVTAADGGEQDWELVITSFNK